MKAFAKINIFLKITGLDEKNYHLLNSRFVLFKGLFDELYLIKDKQKEGFELQSEFECEDNIIYKAYQILCEFGYKNELDECFKNHALFLKKNIPVGAGLGGGSSDGASFLRLMNESLNLQISKEKLMALAARLGADVSFFVSEFESANVSGIGQIVENFADEVPNLRLITPDIFCSTPLVYKAFDELGADFKENEKFGRDFFKKSSKELLSEFSPQILNDLFKPCLNLYPKMSEVAKEGYFLSGSGSALFEAQK